MRTSAIVLVLAALFVLAACTGSQSRPATVGGGGAGASGVPPGSYSNSFTRPQWVPPTGPVGADPAKGWDPREVPPTGPVG